MSKLGDVSLVCVLAGVVLVALAPVLAGVGLPLSACSACTLIALASVAAGLAAGLGARRARSGQVGILLGAPVLCFAAASVAASCLL